MEDNWSPSIQRQLVEDNRPLLENCIARMGIGEQCEVCSVQCNECVSLSPPYAPHAPIWSARVQVQSHRVGDGLALETCTDPGLIIVDLKQHVAHCTLRIVHCAVSFQYVL